MTRIVAALIRHGHYHQPPDTPSAFLPHPLTELGIQQARDCAPAIADWAASHGLRIHPVIDTSRMLRAWQTGQEIAGVLGAAFTITEHEALAERSVGAAANLSLPQIDAVIAADPRCKPLPPRWKADADFRLPLQGAETLREAGARVAAHFEQCMNKLTGGELKLFIGHGAAFRYAAVKLGVLTEDEAPRLSMHHCRPVYLERIDGQWRQAGGEWKVRKQEAMD
jgi:2,3-bisphosphoglycerate-dependent phosphoglycerate mutase